ncbi:MAG: DUF1778 domain-containing protein [Cyanobacteria bacterium WB6_1B_304]|nr:DUF1778 domain-containing protein [Cyanobacteria bacterium WB6_1B_304]
MLTQRKPAKKKSLSVKSTTIPPVRITQEEKHLIYEASMLSGQTISQFIINNLLRVSQSVINKNSILLNSEEYSSLIDQDDSSESENKTLKNAFSRHSGLSGK